MITFYDDRSLAKENINAYFDIEISGLLDNEDKKIIEEFDKSQFLDDVTLKTRFGVCNVTKISTGAKALICIKHFPELVWDISECGVNAAMTMSDFKFDFSVTSFMLPAFRDKTEISYNNQLFESWGDFAKQWAINHDY